ALVVGQLVHQLVHAVEVEGVVRVVGGGGGEGGGPRVAVGGGGGGTRAVVGAPQGDELAADQDGGQGVEGPHRFGANRAQGVEQAEEGALEDVVGLLPAAQLGEAPEHASGEHFEAPGDAAEELVAGALVAGVHAGEPVMELGRARRSPRGGVHGGASQGSSRGDGTRAPEAAHPP